MSKPFDATDPSHDHAADGPHSVPWPRSALLVAPHFHPELIGSAPFCTDLARWLAGRGCAVKVLTMRPHYPPFERFAGYETGARDRETVDGMEIVRVPVARSGRGAFDRMANAGCFVARHRLAARRRGRSDLVFAFVPSVLGLALARAVDRGPIVAIIHDIESGLASGLGLVRSRAVAGAIAAVERFLMARVDRLVTPTRQMSERITRRVGGRVPVHTAPLWAEDGVLAGHYGASERDTVMYSGNLGRKQGFALVAALARSLAEHRPETRLIIRGSGTEEAAVRAEIARSGLAAVEWAPLVAPDALGASLARAQLHIVPQAASAADYAMPSKVLNIMAAGRPFVATAAPGTALHDLAETSGGGRCVAPGDANAFAKTVIALLESPELCDRLGAAGQAHVRATLTRDAVLSALIKTLADLR